MSNATSALAVTKDRLGPFAFHAIRQLERRLSPDALHAFLAPLAFGRATFSSTPRIPEYLGGQSRRRLTEARMDYLLSRVIEFFPDRLATPKWSGRFRTSGLDRIQAAHRSGRNVVLVCFHFGVFKLIPFWLRALGIPVIALLRGESVTRSRAKRLKDKLSPFPELPTVLYSEDQLRSMVRLLSAGNVLLMTADRETRKQITVSLDDRWSFQMATGAIRLAARCNAELIPCCMTDEGNWHFHLEINQPTPREYLAAGPDPLRAGYHILQELLPRVHEHPEQCSHYLLERIRSTAAVSVSLPA